MLTQNDVKQLHKVQKTKIKLFFQRQHQHTLLKLFSSFVSLGGSYGVCRQEPKSVQKYERLHHLRKQRGELWET